MIAMTSWMRGSMKLVACVSLSGMSASGCLDFHMFSTTRSMSTFASLMDARRPVVKTASLELLRHTGVENRPFEIQRMLGSSHPR